MHDRRSLGAFSWYHSSVLSINTQPSVPAFITYAYLRCTNYIHLYDEICICFHKPCTHTLKSLICTGACVVKQQYERCAQETTPRFALRFKTVKFILILMTCQTYRTKYTFVTQQLVADIALHWYPRQWKPCSDWTVLELAIGLQRHCAIMHNLTHWGRGKNGRHFADDILKCIFLNENVWIPIEISLKFVP